MENGIVLARQWIFKFKPTFSLWLGEGFPVDAFGKNGALSAKKSENGIWAAPRAAKAVAVEIFRHFFGGKPREALHSDVWISF